MTIQLITSDYSFPILTLILLYKCTRTNKAKIMTWIKVAETGDIKENSGKEVTANGVKIALFRTTDNYYAIDALCRHQDGSLAPGAVQGEVVECPLHSWHYNIRTGQLLDYLDGVKLKTYKVSCEGNGIYIEV